MHTVREGGRFSFFLQMKMNGGGTEEENKCAQYVCVHTHGCCSVCLAQFTEGTLDPAGSFLHPTQGGETAVSTNQRTNQEPAPTMSITVAL